MDLTTATEIDLEAIRGRAGGASVRVLAARCAAFVDPSGFEIIAAIALDDGFSLTARTEDHRGLVVRLVRIRDGRGLKCSAAQADDTTCSATTCVVRAFLEASAASLVIADC